MAIVYSKLYNHVGVAAVYPPDLPACDFVRNLLGAINLARKMSFSFLAVYQESCKIFSLGDLTTYVYTTA